MNTKKVALSGVIALAVLAAMLVVVPSALAQPFDANSTYFDPMASSGTYCENDTVEVRVNTSVGSRGGQLDIYFDPNCINITAADFTGSPWVNPTFPPSFDHLVDHVRLICSDPSASISGDNLFANITLHYENQSCVCTSDLNFSGVIISDAGGNAITMATHNGTADGTPPGCVGDDYTFYCGDTVNQSCTLSGNMVCPAGAGLIVGNNDIVIDGAEYSITGNANAALCGGALATENSPAVHSGILMIAASYDNVVIKDFEIKNFCTGIALGSSAADNVDNVTVTCCEIHDNGADGNRTHGIHMVMTNDCTICQNDIYNNTGSGSGCGAGGNGIFLYGGSGPRGNYNNITCNNLYENTRSGFFAKKAPQHNIISYNNASFNGEGGIVPLCKNSKFNKIEYNVIMNNTMSGIRTKGDNNTIRYNTVTNHASSRGIWLWNHTVSGVVMKADNNIVTNNTLCGNNQDIQVDAGCAGNVVQSNTCDVTNAGGCPWTCDDLVPVYYDFDQDGMYSKATCDCSCPKGAGACCNPGKFNDTGADTHCAGGVCVLTEGNDLNDCDDKIGPKGARIMVMPKDTIIQPQDQFDVSITVNSYGMDVHSVQYYLTYNTSVVRAETQVKGPFLGEHDETIVDINNIDQAHGIVSYAEVRKGADGKVGNGKVPNSTVATIQFTAIGNRADVGTLNFSDVILVKPDLEKLEPVEPVNGTVTINANQPPVANGTSKHRINNVAKKYPCITLICSCSTDPDFGDKGGNITYIRWAFGDGQYGTSEGLPVDNCTCKEHKYESWKWDPIGYPPSAGGHYLPFDVQLTVTDDGCPELTNTTNFHVNVYRAGDANGDGEVNVIDAAYVGRYWLKTCPNTNPCVPPSSCYGYLWDTWKKDRADLNNDCEINILDAALVGANWRHTAW